MDHPQQPFCYLCRSYHDPDVDHSNEGLWDRVERDPGLSSEGKEAAQILKHLSVVKDRKHRESEECAQDNYEDLLKESMASEQGWQEDGAEQEQKIVDLKEDNVDLKAEISEKEEEIEEKDKKLEEMKKKLEETEKKLEESERQQAKKDTRMVELEKMMEGF
ncbi:uncharacterized protein BDZ99DRAFT_519874 [Mytilinidion resinicola]|uniref:Uncharacterized protein n=1 Tax=Mytilinidion resinicola TaxID=574789 RepID=A0A6A6YS65_9PEZI|nr:uncharacterized protein BDZ99DRAFT_519874 [Mytilinidion resinicola]KAF2811213.1 hypothetical protein BDZ99DRAFT_519874 [Mytilinidion resinicola]